MIHYTTIEQSKKLVELGLNSDTADMKWYYWKNEIDAPKVPTLGFDKAVLESYKNAQAIYLPCWSLGALLEVMPKGVQTNSNHTDVSVYITFVRNGIVTDTHHVKNNTYLEAAYNMVCWLLENGYIKKGE